MGFGSGLGFVAGADLGFGSGLGFVAGADLGFGYGLGFVAGADLGFGTDLGLVVIVVSFFGGLPVFFLHFFPPANFFFKDSNNVFLSFWPSRGDDLGFKIGLSFSPLMKSVNKFNMVFRSLTFFNAVCTAL